VCYLYSRVRQCFLPLPCSPPAPPLFSSLVFLFFVFFVFFFGFSICRLVI
jgi:hypothetical protein